jgi:hypothetical protein
MLRRNINLLSESCPQCWLGLPMSQRILPAKWDNAAGVAKKKATPTFFRGRRSWLKRIPNALRTLCNKNALQLLWTGAISSTTRKIPPER